MTGGDFVCPLLTKIESDEKREENRKPPDVQYLEGTDGSTDLSFIKARVDTRDVRDGAPYPAGLSQELLTLPFKES